MKKLMLFLGLYLFANALIAQKDSGLIILQHVNVIDGYSNKPLINLTVTIKGGKIFSTKKRYVKTPEDAIVFDLKGKWLLPGYIDAHVHLFDFAGAKAALASGVTTARTMGSSNFFDLDIRKKHTMGGDSLPDIVASGYQIRPDMSEEFFKDFPEFNHLRSGLHGVENVQNVAKALLSHGINVIKILATERAGTPETDPRKKTFTNEELLAIVHEASKAGIPVAAHAQGDEGAYAAIKAGVRSIEHGSYLSDRTLELMKRMGTYLVPTFSFWEQTANSPQSKSNPVLLERTQTFLQLVNDVTARAYKMGIPIVAGTDTWYVVDGLTMSTEAEKLFKAGMPPMEVIKAMTYRSALCLKVNDRTGAVRKGMEADLVVLDQSPLTNISALKKILMVINNGKLVIYNLQ